MSFNQNEVSGQGKPSIELSVELATMMGCIVLWRDVLQLCSRAEGRNR
jgi:hypothetical protein